MVEAVASNGEVFLHGRQAGNPCADSPPSYLITVAVDTGIGNVLLCHVGNEGQRTCLPGLSGQTPAMGQPTVAGANSLVHGAGVPVLCGFGRQTSPIGRLISSALAVVISFLSVTLMTSHRRLS